MRAVALILAVLFLADLVPVVEPQGRPSSHLMFVVDVSGSMRGDKFASACQAVCAISEQSTDEMFMAVVAFNDAPKHWPGVPENGLAQGWAKLPNLETVQKAQAWLNGIGAGGDTLVVPALKEALKDPTDNLTVVLVTDGIFQRESDDEVLKALAEGQKARKGAAFVMVYGVGAEQEILRKIGTEGRGGYMRERPSLAIPVPPIQGSVR